MLAIQTGVRLDINVVFLISISFMAKDVEHFFMYLLAIHTYSFENCLNFTCAFIQ
jgi:hypothetical protein